MPKLTVMPEGTTIEFVPGKSLMEIMTDAGLFINNACGGRGICGKCRIKIADDVGETSETEKGILRAADIRRGIRLACMVHPSSDLSVELIRTEKKQHVLTSGYMPDFEFDPVIPDIAPADCEHGQTRSDAEIPLFGVAIDIGTTTVVCSLIDIKTGEMLGQESGINEQKAFGSDVLTRITYEIEHPKDGFDRLQKAIIGSINGMVASICSKSGIKPNQICSFTVSANCTMMHMLLGEDARPIGSAPFTPVFTEAKDLEASMVGLIAAPGARLYCLPSVSAYIGGDIVAGVYVCDLKHRDGNTMFIDIGTNSEMVLESNGRLIACSCAAGPALEGMNLSCGMRAEEGAVEDIHIDEDGLDIKVIGGAAPVGICGSGILAVTRELLRTGIIRNTGAFIKAEKLSADDYRAKYIHVDEKGRRAFMLFPADITRKDNTSGQPEILVTQADVRQVQLAKGAILSGFTTLLKKAGIKAADLDRVLIAGQFGAHLPAESITGAGILPFEVESKIEYVGNTSATGSYMALMSSKARRDMEALSLEIGHIDLAAEDHYEALLSDCLTFPDIN